MNNEWKGLTYAALAGIMTGALGYFGIEAMNDHIAMPDMLFWRYFLASIILLLFCIVKFRGKLWQNIVDEENNHLKSLVICGISYAGIGYFYFEATPKYIESGLAMVLYFTFPIIVAILSWLFEKEPFSKFVTISLILMFVGLACLGFKRHSHVSILGIFLCLASAAFMSIFVLGKRKFIKKYDTNIFATMVCISSSIVFAIISYIKLGCIPLPKGRVWFDLLVIAFFCSVMNVVLFAKALDYISATKASIMVLFQPLVAVILGVICFKEHLNNIQIFGIILVCFSSLIVQFDKKTTKNLTKR